MPKVQRIRGKMVYCNRTASLTLGRADAQQHHGHRAGDVAVEDVRAHSGDIAHVVAHVVGDHGGVAGVILWDADLNLADEVGSDVGRLRVNSTAGLRQQRQRRSSEAESEHNVRVLGQEIYEVHPDHGNADHGQSHHGAGLESDIEGGVQAALGGDCAADVGGDGDPHPDVPGDGGEDASSHEGSSHLEAIPRIAVIDAKDQRNDK